MVNNNETAVTGWYLENTISGHKFYTVLISDNGVVTTSWGKIGTNGQSKVQRLTEVSEARDIGMRQVYSKKSRGYVMVSDEIKFVVPTQTLNDACSQNSASGLDRIFHKARREPRFDGDKKAVFQHYDGFVEQAHKLLERVGKATFDDLYGEFEDLKKAWEELDDKHAEAATTVSIVEQMLQQALLTGGK